MHFGAPTLEIEPNSPSLLPNGPLIQSTLFASRKPFPVPTVLLSTGAIQESA